MSKLKKLIEQGIKDRTLIYWGKLHQAGTTEKEYHRYIKVSELLQLIEETEPVKPNVCVICGIRPVIYESDKIFEYILIHRKGDCPNNIESHRRIRKICIKDWNEHNRLLREGR